MLRERQLAYQVQAAASEVPSATWRRESVSEGRGNQLLERRGLPPLSLKVPLVATGVGAEEAAVFVGIVALGCPNKPVLRQAAVAHPVVAAAAATLAAAEVAAQQPRRTTLSPAQEQQRRVKRSRLAAPPCVRPLVQPPPAVVPHMAGHLIAPQACASSPRVIALEPLATSHSHGSAAATATATAHGAVGIGPSVSPGWWRKIRSILSPANSAVQQQPDIVYAC